MMSCDVMWHALAVKKVGSHEELQCDFRCNWELWDLGAAVGVADFVVKVHANLAQDMGTSRGKGRGGEGREGRGGERRGGEGRRGGRKGGRWEKRMGGRWLSEGR